jgi:methylated-DNA-[protein]-cysteine S-methyltransferase
MTYSYRTITSPVGTLKLIASDKGLAGILWKREDPDRAHLTPLVKDPANPFIVEAERQLGAYFAGRLKAFTVPLDFKGTEFQKRVWKALLTIPFGETRTYRQIARQIGKPTAFRAVGAANGRNPISIIAPCHRVIGSNGELTGYAGGLPVKERLLRLEGRDQSRVKGQARRPRPKTQSRTRDEREGSDSFHARSFPRRSSSP